MSYDNRGSRAARDRAMARPELRMSPNSIPVEKQLPDDGRECTVWAVNETGSYRIPFAVTFRNGQWLNPKSDPLAVRIIGWSYR